ncbi:monocarboxylate transporter 14-like [Tubulanus polymorphus]|uniref:monocarboxylate transporter 14-like n=1 Tax=Tubulanus polymorphus TaxID=672921 RepID=UPI003DA670DB
MNTRETFREPGLLETIVITCVLFIISTINGTHYILGIYVAEWQRYFAAGYGVTAFIGTCYTGFTCCFAPLATVLIKRYGTRLCLLIAGIFNGLTISLSAFAPNIYVIIILWSIAGIANSFHLGPIAAYVVIRFRKYRAIVNGIAITGCSAGTFLLALFANDTIELYSWRGSVWILGGVCFHHCSLCLLLKDWNTNDKSDDLCYVESNSTDSYPANDRLLRDYVNGLPTEIRTGEITDQKSKCERHLNVEKPTDVKMSKIIKSITSLNKNDLKANLVEILHLRLFRKRAFLTMSLHMLFYYMSASVVYLHVVSGFENLLKITIEQARFMVSVIGISGVFGRVVGSFLTHFKRIDTLSLYLAIDVMLAVASFLVPVFEGFTAGIILSVFLGFSVSGIIATMPLVLIELLEDSDLVNMSIGYCYFFIGIGSFIGAPLAGWIYDITGNYAYSFYVGGALASLSSLAIVPYWIRHVRKLQH